jgi:hypothetical protein
MPAIRFRIRTIMIVIAASAVVMGVLRFIIWATSVLGVRLFFSAALAFAIMFALPIALVVEFSFFASCLWFRQKPAGGILREAFRATLKLDQTADRMEV